MKRRKTLGSKIIARLAEFTRNLEAGIPIEGYRLMRVQTPDGPMHYREPMVLRVPKKRKGDGE